MNIVYNDIFLTGVRLNSWTREPVLDGSGQDWLFDRHTIDVTCIFNPNLTSGSSAVRELAGGVKDFRFVPYAGATAGATDGSIREVLMTPRRKLIVYSGDDKVFEAPSAQLGAFRPTTLADTDANNGPIVRRCSIIKALSDRTFLVHFVVEACTRECPEGNHLAASQALLSNRYSTTHSVDEHHYTTITYNGISVFRTDILELEKKFADSYRSDCIPAPRLGFQRMSVQVQAVPGRNALTWTVVDREMPYFLGQGKKNRYGVVEFRATKTQTVQKMNGIAAGMPTLTVQCWAAGNNASSRWNVTKFCMDFVVSECQIGRFPGIQLNDLTITQHLHEKVAEITCTVSFPPAITKGPNNGKPPANDGSGWGGAWSHLLNDELTFLMDPNRICPQPPNDNATRGTYPYLIIANDAATKAACQPIRKPNQAPEAQPNKGNPVVRKPGGGASVGPTSVGENPAAPSPIGDPRSITSMVNGVSVQAEVVDDWPMPASKVRARAHWYTDCRVYVHWITHSGRIVMPICGGSAVQVGTKRVGVIDAHTAYQEKIVEYEMVRVGKEPESVNPYSVASQSSYQDETLMDHRFTNGAPVTGPDGFTLIYSRKGVAKYIFQRSFRVEGANDFPTAVVPWLSLPFSQAYATAKSFVHHIAEEFTQPDDDRLPTDFETLYRNDDGTWNRGPTVNGRS